MRYALILTVFATFFATPTFAQSTIWDEPLDVSFYSGPMGVLLPGYSFGVDANGDPAFSDDLDNLGARWELNMVRRFLGTRTSFETNVFFGLVEANAVGSDQALDMPNPSNAGNSNLGGRDTHLESKLYHYGGDALLRDTWRTRFGGLSAGFGFSYMAFDQEFDLERDGAGFIDEKLNSDFVGVKGILGWDGRLLGRRSNIDLGFGYYDLDMDYDYSSGPLNQTYATSSNEDAFTIEVNSSTWFCLRGYDTAFNIGVMYISDLPQMVHPAAAQSFIDTEDGVLINAGLEIRL